MTDLDPDAPEVPNEHKSIGTRILNQVPKVLSSKLHILWLFILFLWIVVFAALAPHHVSQRTELILGNYTNVTSDIGACIAAGGTIAAVKHLRKQGKVQEARFEL